MWHHNVVDSKHLLGSSGGDEAGRLMLTGTSTGGTHILHFFAHLPYIETSVYIINLKLFQTICQTLANFSRLQNI